MTANHLVTLLLLLLGVQVIAVEFDAAVYCEKKLGTSSNGYFEHPHDCHYFIACLKLFGSFIYYFMPCPATLYYQASSHQCVFYRDFSQDSTCLQQGMFIIDEVTTPATVAPAVTEVCWEAKDDKFATVKIKTSGHLSSIKLEHVSGVVNCVSDSICESYWGCSKPFFLEGKIGTVITDGDNNLLFPKLEDLDEVGFFLLDGFDEHSSYIEFISEENDQHFVEKDQELRIWYGEDFMNMYEEDNTGRHCANVIVNVQ